MSNVSLQGDKVVVAGKLPATGCRLPDFKLVSKELEDVTVNSYSEQCKLIYIVPSVDTPVCSDSSKKFAKLIKEAQLNNIAYLLISADLPFAMARFRKSEEHTSNIHFLSMMRSQQFAKDYGVLIETGPLAGITARAVIVANREDDVVYSELVAEISDEPNYQQALDALNSVANQ